jgi:hypothetical protein
VKFWVSWAIGALVSAACVYFFVVGLADGSVSSFNGGLWFVMLATCTGVLSGSYLLHARGRTGPALLLSLVLSLPGLLFGLFMLVILLTNPRWN